MPNIREFINEVNSIKKFVNKDQIELFNEPIINKTPQTFDELKAKTFNNQDIKVISNNALKSVLIEILKTCGINDFLVTYGSLTKNTKDSGIFELSTTTGHRYDLNKLYQCLKKISYLNVTIDTKHEYFNDSIYNRLIITFPSNFELDGKRILIDKKHSIITLRGHSEVASTASQNTDYQEAIHAYYILISQMNHNLGNKQTELSYAPSLNKLWKFGLSLDNVINYIFDKVPINYLISAQKAAGAVPKDLNIKEIGSFRNAGSIANIITKQFNKLKGPSNINSIYPPDIYILTSLYNSESNFKADVEKIETLQDFTTTLNNYTGVDKGYIPISLKLNPDKRKSKFELINKKTNTSINNPEIVFKTTDAIKIINNAKKPIIPVTFMLENRYITLTFRNYGSSGISFDGRYNKIDILDYEAEELDYSLNTSSVFGKGKAAFDYYSIGKKELNKDDAQMTFNKQFNAFITSIITEYKAKFVAANTDKLLDYFNDWCERVRLIKNGLIYALMCSKKENYGDMNMYPMYYKIS